MGFVYMHKNRHLHNKRKVKQCKNVLRILKCQKKQRSIYATKQKKMVCDNTCNFLLTSFTLWGYACYFFVASHHTLICFICFFVSTNPENYFFCFCYVYVLSSRPSPMHCIHVL